MGKKRAVGIIVNEVDDVQNTLTLARSIGFDYVCAQLVNNDVTARMLESDTKYVNEPFTFSDLSLSSTDWSHSFVATISKLSDELSGRDRKLRKKASDLIKHEIDYCMHLNVPAILVEPDPKCIANMAEIVNGKLQEFLNSIWVQIPMIVKPGEFYPNPWIENAQRLEEDGDSQSGWYTWSAFHAECNFEKTVGVALEMSIDIPSEVEVKRWLGEPIKCVIIPTDVFVRNHKGYPVLTKLHQQLLNKLLAITTQVLIKPNGPVVEEHKFYKQYIDFTYKKYDEDNVEDAWMVGYDDFLQSPLQPLMNNLESHTYEVFEKDPIKYVLYEQAIAAAILSKQPEPTSEKLVVMVVGAGRGPIVKCAILASKKTCRPINLFALEKNRNAVNTLLHLQRTLWKEWDFNVTVVHSDMRKWKPNVKADIIVSELLGSFGDNELSPECLDGAQDFLQDDGIMIPQSYTSYVHPIMSSKLHAEVKTYPEKNSKTDAAHFQTPYVVHMKNKFDIAEPQKLFEYKHPNTVPNDTNDRCKQLDFVSNSDCVLSGFAGYFESELFGGILMSILPSSFTQGMFSWFPIYFPIKSPIKIKKDDTVSLRFRRCSSDRSVWYEWGVISPTIVSTHNLNGCAYEIGL